MNWIEVALLSSSSNGSGIETNVKGHWIRQLHSIVDGNGVCSVCNVATWAEQLCTPFSSSNTAASRTSSNSNFDVDLLVICVQLPEDKHKLIRVNCCWEQSKGWQSAGVILASHFPAMVVGQLSFPKCKMTPVRLQINSVGISVTLRSGKTAGKTRASTRSKSVWNSTADVTEIININLYRLNLSANIPAK